MSLFFKGSLINWKKTPTQSTFKSYITTDLPLYLTFFILKENFLSSLEAKIKS